MTDAPVALVISPHPDDELIPAGGTLMVLKDAGWRIVNLACSLGRPEQIETRRAELTRACTLAGFDLTVVEPPVGLTSADDLAAARDRLASIIASQLAALRPSLVLAPGLADGHHAHETVAAAVTDAVQLGGLPVTVWSWELWGHLRAPTLLVRVDHALDRVCAALAEHASQVARNDYFRLVRSRAAVASILGPERIFGFGQPGVAYAAAEILSETVYSDGTWRLGAPRELNVIDPTVTPAGETDRA